MPRRREQVLPSKKEIGQRVRALRKESGMTQVELAQALGTQQTNLSQIERGIRGVGLKQILRLSRALSVPADKILAPSRSERTTSPRNEKLLRRVRRIEKLPPEHQEAVVKMIDAFLDTRDRSNGRR